MYYEDASGKLRTIRSSSQLECLHRHMNAAVPGTKMGLKGMDDALLNFHYRCLACYWLV